MSTVNKKSQNVLQLIVGAKSQVGGAEPYRTTFEEFFIDIMWNEDDTHTLFSELAFSDEYCSDRLFEWCLRKAKERNIKITDANTCDYDELIYESYKDSLYWNRK